MNITKPAASQQNTFQARFSRARDEVSLEFDRDDRKNGHAPFRQTLLSQDLWDSMGELPRPQQVNMTAGVLAMQLVQNGVGAHNRDFIKGIKQRFSTQEMETMKGLLRSQPLFEQKGAPKIEPLLKQLEEVWGKSDGQEVLKTRTPPMDVSPARIPDHVFFRTSMRQNPLIRGTLNAGL